METYRFYPPQMSFKQVPYQVMAPGVADCQHELLDDAWCDRIAVRDGIVFITFSCRNCRRQVSQSLDEVLPPTNWSHVDH